MASPQTWLEILAWLKTLFETTKATIDLTTTYQKYRQDRETIQESQRVSVAFASTYSDTEVDALLKRIEACRDRFIAEGSGKNRNACLCSVFQDAIDGNGGTLPLIDDWEKMYRTLGCARK